MSRNPLGAFDDLELLFDRADGNHHPSPDLELFEKRSWYLIACSGHDKEFEIGPPVKGLATSL